jgi:hypothetical protein
VTRKLSVSLCVFRAPLPVEGCTYTDSFPICPPYNIRRAGLHNVRISFLNMPTDTGGVRDVPVNIQILQYDS